jgi:hypothetical protein
MRTTFSIFGALASSVIVLSLAGCAGEPQDEVQTPGLDRGSQRVEEGALAEPADGSASFENRAAIIWPNLDFSRVLYQRCAAPFQRPAVSATVDAAKLDQWLATNTRVADAMRWMQPIEAASADQQATLAWKDWPSALRDTLRRNFVDYWAWYARGMSGSDPTPVNDPPDNLAANASAAYAFTGMKESDASALYVKYAALSLVVELQKGVPWSVLDYDDASLRELFDSRRFFNRFKKATGYELVQGSVLPPPPLMAAKLVADQKITCSTRPTTIAEAVFWARTLSHYYNTSDTWRDAVDFWQYRGSPPGSRVITGTAFSGTRTNVPTDVRHYTMGCHGTTGMLKALLRTVNIPVEHYSNRNDALPSSVRSRGFAWTGHATPHFLSEGLWLSHGDDPYMVYQDTLPFPISTLLINDYRFDAWFGPSNDSTTVNANVGRMTEELARRLAYLKPMAVDRAKDRYQSPATPDENLRKYYRPYRADALYSWDAWGSNVKRDLDAIIDVWGNDYNAIVSGVYSQPKYYPNR